MVGFLNLGCLSEGFCYVDWDILRGHYLLFTASDMTLEFVD